MPLPTPLLRKNKNAHKNDFGHVLIIAGSKRMLGAAALSALAAMRSGSGLVTLGVPKSLNNVLQKKIAHVVMTLPLNETKDQSISLSAFEQIKSQYPKFDAIAIGPGMSTHPNTQKLILKVIGTSPKPLIIDADALNALGGHCDILKKTKTTKVLTPHPGEMSRLIKKRKSEIEVNRNLIAKQFADQFNCTLLLKGSQTVVATKGKQTYVNKTGNSGLATAGSGDVLTGIITAFIGQGLTPHEAARLGAWVHGTAGDLCVKAKTKVSLIASDLCDCLPLSFKKLLKSFS